MTLISNIGRALWSYARAHKVLTAVAALIVLGGGYQAYATVTKPAATTTYTTATAATSTVVSTATETGQVSASQELPLTPKASGEVTGVYVTPGEHVVAGQIIAQLDASDALQTLANAQLSLKNEELSYEQATATSTLTLNLLTAKNDLTNAKTSLQKTHDASYASLTTIYSDFSTITNGLDNALHKENVPGRTTQENIDAFADAVSQYDDAIGIYKNAAETSYTAAITAYDTALAAYKATSLSASNTQLASLADTTYTAAQAIAQAVKDAHDFFDRVNTDYTEHNLNAPSVLATLLSNTSGYATTINSDLSTTLTIKSNIVSAEQAVASAQNTLEKTQSGSNALTVQQAKLALQQAQQAVVNARQSVADYTVTAPFAGTIAAVDVKKYDQASSGTTVATLVSSQQTVDVSVNEIDASKIKVGQPVTITFDALPDVTIAGTVATIDRVGNVSQGVVSYSVVIRFDTENASVLPGMSATANIIVGQATGVTIPASAIKTAGTQNYVEVIPTSTPASSAGTYTNVTPERVPVTVGITDDTNTIVTGIPVGTRVVTKTTSGTSATANGGSSSFGTGRGTGAFRAIGG